MTINQLSNRMKNETASNEDVEIQTGFRMHPIIPNVFLNTYTHPRVSSEALEMRPPPLWHRDKTA